MQSNPVTTCPFWLPGEQQIPVHGPLGVAATLADYAGIVGRLLAKGHARTSGASMIAGYLGGGEKAAKAFTRFARLYSDQTEADHAALVLAARDGRVPITDGALAEMGSAIRPGGFDLDELFVAVAVE